jgi:hypothetical protein
VVGFLIVFTRNYNILEKTSSILLWVFLTLITIVTILFWPPLNDWIQAIIPVFPTAIEGLETNSGLMTLAVLFVVLGSGFGPTVSYIWFAKDKKMGMFEPYEKGIELELEDLTEEEVERLKGWRKVVLYQNLVSATILSFFSIMIWIAAAQTLHIQGKTPVGDDLIPQMVSIFTTTYGEWSGIIFILCGALALFSSILGPLYGFSRLWEESLERFGFYNRFKVKKETVYRICLTFFALLPMIFIFFITNPMFLFSLASMLTGPILGLMYIIPVVVSYLETKNIVPELNPKRYWAIALAVISGILIIVLSILGI